MGGSENFDENVSTLHYKYIYNTCLYDICYRIEHGDGSHTYSVVTGSVPVPPPPDAPDAAKEQPTFKMVAVVVRKLKQSLDLEARTTKSMTVMTAVAYSGEPLTQVAIHISHPLCFHF